MEEREAELLERCLNRVLGHGLPLHGSDGSLVLGSGVQTLVGVAQQVQQAFQAQPRPARKAEIRRRFLEAAAQPRSSQLPAPRSFWPLVKPALAACLAMAVTAYGVVQTSAGALPGDLLYPVKLSAEQLSLALTPDPTAKAALYLELVEKRTEEVIALTLQGKEVQPEALATLALETMRAAAVVDHHDVAALAGELARVTARQQEVLAQVAQAAPPAVGDAVQKAFAASHQSRDTAQAHQKPSPAHQATQDRELAAPANAATSITIEVRADRPEDEGTADHSSVRAPRNPQSPPNGAALQGPGRDEDRRQTTPERQEERDRQQQLERERERTRERAEQAQKEREKAEEAEAREEARRRADAKKKAEKEAREQAEEAREKEEHEARKKAEEREEQERRAESREKADEAREKEARKKAEEREAQERKADHESGKKAEERGNKK